MHLLTNDLMLSELQKVLLLTIAMFALPSTQTDRGFEFLLPIEDTSTRPERSALSAGRWFRLRDVEQ